MLARLSIRDIVLIERLDIEFSRGLAVLTGETGAGKSILLDAFAGARRPRRRRPGPSWRRTGPGHRGVRCPQGHPAAAILSDNGLMIRFLTIRAR
jgi:DNA repair protein RecN (Recombination protein N)